MIIFLIVLFTLLTYIGLVVLKSLLLRILIGGTSILMLVLSVGLLTLHLDKNWGTKIVTSRQRSTDIYTAGDLSSPFGMIIKAEIGQNTGNYVFIYRTSKTEKKASPQFKPATDSISQIVTAIKKKATYQVVDLESPEVETITKRREFTDKWSKLLFGIGGEEGQLVQEISTIKIPEKTWLLLTEAQADKLVKSQADLMKQQAAELKADPEKALALEKLKKSNPKAYSELMVSQLKTFLGIKN
ncbi:DUF4811 domain-containing protein [Lactococcus fujiensis]|uniref:DUF4811 domain-containing protein n=1 Tax=Lactococcus fujiensis TaxID=610251 RepID=UPI000BDEF371|nr:DUF4811 domain-containing protein [Lactococcus fujiensis]